MQKQKRSLNSSNNELCLLTVLTEVHMLHYHGRKERNVLFNDAFNTFYLRLYGVRPMVKDQ